MRTRAAVAVVALALLAGGCAVGRFIAGAPAAPRTAAIDPLLLRRCASCHVVPNPQAMSGDQWRAALERMKHRMQLPAAEWDSLAAMAKR